MIDIEEIDRLGVIVNSVANSIHSAARSLLSIERFSKRRADSIGVLCERF